MGLFQGRNVGEILRTAGCALVHDELFESDEPHRYRAVATLNGSRRDAVKVDTTQLKQHVHLGRRFSNSERRTGLRPDFGVDGACQLCETKCFQCGDNPNRFARVAWTNVSKSALYLGAPWKATASLPTTM